MKYSLLASLACPACGGRDLRLETHRTSSSPLWRAQQHAGRGKGDNALIEVEEGVLSCADCAQFYPVEEGIPRLVTEVPRVTTSAHVRTSFDSSAPEWESSFLDFASPLTPADFTGVTCLDVGCGFGRGAFFAARYGADVIGVDLDWDVLRTARRNLRGNPRVNFVQADAHALPFSADHFDLVYAFGLLHHVREPELVLAQCSEKVRRGGRLSVWVYGPRQGTAAALSALLRGVVRDMPPDDLLNVSRLLASFSRAFSHTPYRAMRHVPGLSVIAHRIPLHDHHQWPYEIVVSDIYDRLRISVTQTFRSEDLDRAFADIGYLDVRVSRRVGNSESFRATGIKR